MLWLLRIFFSCHPKAVPGIFSASRKAQIPRNMAALFFLLLSCSFPRSEEEAPHCPLLSDREEEDLSEENIIVSALDPRVADVVADAVEEAAKKSGVIRQWEKTK